MVPRQKRKEFGADLKAIFAAPDRRSAMALVCSVSEKWRQKGNGNGTGHLEEHLAECLRYLTFPESHRERIRTTTIALRDSTRE